MLWKAASQSRHAQACWCSDGRLRLCCWSQSEYHSWAASCDVDPEDPATWHVDPLRCPLPHAPSLQMFCLYGVGKPTERAYQYLNLQTEEVHQP